MSFATPHEGPTTGEPAPPGFQRRLSLFDATMMVAGTMIGSGIFLVSADIARDMGSSGWLMAIWILTGVMTVMGALCYAELAAMMPQAGGQYIFLREAYSPLWGFLYGWTCFLVIQTGSIAAVGVAFSKFLGVLVPQLGAQNELLTITGLNWKVEMSLPWMAEPLVIFKREKFTISAGQLVAVAIVAFLTWLNCRGVQEGKLVQNIFTVAKTLALIGLIAVGLSVAADADVAASNLANLWNGATQTPKFEEISKQLPSVDSWVVILMIAGGAMVGALFSADAWNNVTFIAGEMKDPRRNLPRSLVLGTVGVIVLYLLANLAYLAALPVRATPEVRARVAAFDARIDELAAAGRDNEVEAVTQEKNEYLDRLPIRDRGIEFARDDRVGTAVMELGSPRLGTVLMAVAIMISTFGCVNGMALMGARLYYAMAQDNLFFHSVGQLNARGVPAAGLILQGAWSILLLFSGTYSELLDYVIFASLFFYVLTVVGLFILRRRQPNLERPYRVFGYPWMPALYAFLCGVIMLDLLYVRPEYTWPGLIIVLTGIPVYFVWRIVAGKAPPAEKSLV